MGVQADVVQEERKGGSPNVKVNKCQVNTKEELYKKDLALIFIKVNLSEKDNAFLN